MFDISDAVLDQASNFQKDQISGQFSLFSGECASGETSNPKDVPVPDVPEWDELTKLSFEKDLMGFLCHRAPAYEIRRPG